MILPPENYTEEQTLKANARQFVHGAHKSVQTRLQSFVVFIREQGVVGLAIGFLLSGAVSKTVSSLVDNVINPLIGLAMGRVNLADKVIGVGSAAVKYGAFISSVVDFIIIAAVIYFIFRGLGLDRLDKKSV